MPPDTLPPPPLPQQSVVNHPFEKVDDLNALRKILLYLIKSNGGHASFSKAELELMQNDETQAVVYWDEFGNYHIDLNGGKR